MTKRAEISVFLSLVLVCMLSLLLSLLESARTTGARLYAQIAADSASASVMSQYNRSLWDVYHLLFLEAESDAAIVQSFSDYLEYYTDQDNLYPMKLVNVNVDFCEKMTANGGKALEESILSHMKYQILDEFGDFGEEAVQVTEDAEKVLQTEDFQEWFEVCHEIGGKSRKLDRYYVRAEQSLSRLRILKEELSESSEVSETKKTRFYQETEKFFDYVDAYETELKKISEHLAELKAQEHKDLQIIQAYENVELEGRNVLETFFVTRKVLEQNLEILGRIEENTELVALLEIPGEEVSYSIDEEKSSALDRLEELFQGTVLNLVLPENTEVSKNAVSLKNIPSTEEKHTEGNRENNRISQALVNEYCLLAFDSFLEKCERKTELEFQPLEYEQEYLLCGCSSDRENLKKTIDKVMTVRGAANLTCLLSSSEKRAEASRLAVSVTGGTGPAAFLVSFFILTLWAYGESVLDMKQLMIGGAVPYWKQEDEWKLSLEGLLSFQFMDSVQEKQENGSSYRDHLRILFFLTNQEVRNFRMMDVIQWNLRTIQENFSVADCCIEVEFSVKLQERHLFFVKNTYERTIKTVGAY